MPQEELNLLIKLQCLRMPNGELGGFRITTI